MVEYRSSQFIRLTPWDIFPRGKDIPGRLHHLWIRCIGISILGFPAAFAVISRKTYRIPVYFITAHPHRQ